MKRTPLVRKTPLRRTGFQPHVGSEPKRMRRTHLRQASPRLAAARAQYSKEVKKWKALPENKWCRVAAAGVLHPLGTPQRIRAQDCHHMNGREGKLLLEKKWWLPVSRAGHNWIRDHANEARKLGFLI